MIQVKVFQRPDGRPQGLQVTGHAGLAEAGQDILCAAVSVLTENLAASLKLLLQLEVSLTAHKGFYSLKLREDTMNGKSDLLFGSTILGLQALAKQYPAQLQITQVMPKG